MKKLAALVILLVCSFPLYVFGQSTINYFKGPSFPAAGGGTLLDINVDGVPDYIFYSGLAICTENPFFSACEFPYEVGSGTNELLASDYALSQPFGTWIGAISPVGAAWIAAEPLAAEQPLTVYYSGYDWNARKPESYWFGSLGVQGIGYLGVRFHAADGLHYGWIRVRLPALTTEFEFSPVVMEWAYETSPDTPIRAGATGSTSDEFKMKFRKADGSADNPGTGTVQLIGNSMRYELHVSGGYGSADLSGPEPPHSKGKPVLNLNRPLIAARGFSVFLVR